MERKTAEDETRILIASLMTDAKVSELLHRIKDFDYCTFRHCLNVAYITGQAVIQMGLDETLLTQITLGALLHDVGKIKVPQSIIKKGGCLNPEEFAEVRKHPQYGNEILREHGFPDIVCEIAYLHHEKKDGSGYPTGIIGKEIPHHVKIVAVIDAYDAMTSERSYKHAYDGKFTLDSLSNMGGYSSYILDVVDAVSAR